MPSIVRKERVLFQGADKSGGFGVKSRLPNVSKRVAPKEDDPIFSTLYGAAEYREWLEEYFQSFRITALSEPDRTVLVDGNYATEYTTYMRSTDKKTTDLLNPCINSSGKHPNREISHLWCLSTRMTP